MNSLVTVAVLAAFCLAATSAAPSPDAEPGYRGGFGGFGGFRGFGGFGGFGGLRGGYGGYGYRGGALSLLLRLLLSLKLILVT
ncbi:neuropeptide-like protein 28 [Cherax quadricarinatus]|uniref:neuropeptide-like protein 28 n=1 Tax=Cherax quadricarinatus TaxID=27406 RepID=UPI00387EB576